MRKIIAMLLAVPIVVIANAQGCSDAGFCTIGNLGHQSASNQSSFKHYFKLTLPSGLGDEDVFVFGPGLEYGFQKSHWQFSGKVTGNYASGNLGEATGAGDVFLSATYNLPTSQRLKVSFTVGTKLPLNQGNLNENGLSLPMQYQSSLGTVDFIGGVAVNADRWKVAVGWQQPLTGINRNNFLPQYWRNGEANAYPPTNDFYRRGDVLLRTSYRLLMTKALSLESGLLGIYHLNEDTYIDANSSNKPISIKGSAGLTVNATASLELILNERCSIGLMGGVPLVVRDIRPDGLTRSFVVTPQIIYHF